MNLNRLLCIILNTKKQTIMQLEQTLNEKINNTKSWIKEKSVKITEGYKNPFTGDLMDDRTYVHFRTFAATLEKCEQFDSLDEFLSFLFKQK